MSESAPFAPPPATHWPSSNFVLAAGTATFQPSTRKVLIIQDTARTLPGTPRQSCLWFLPRGRKDIGETIEACAIRETLEEAGYAATLLRAPHPTRQPAGATPSAATAHTEAFHLQLLPHISRRSLRLPREQSDICLYAAFWYLCTIPVDAVRVSDYGAHFVGRHEQGYNSELVGVEEAVALLSSGRFEYRESEGRVLDRGTGHEVRWGEVKAGFDGGVEALVVARGWEVVKRMVEGEEEWVDEEGGGR